MDPVTIVSLAGTAAQLADFTAKSILGLRDLAIRYQNATRWLGAIQRECETLNTVLRQLHGWIEFTLQHAEDRDQRMGPLKLALDSLEPGVAGLCKEVEGILSKSNENGTLRRRDKMSLAWNESTMKNILEEVRWQSHHLGLLLHTTKL